MSCFAALRFKMRRKRWLVLSDDLDWIDLLGALCFGIFVFFAAHAAECLTHRSCRHRLVSPLCLMAKMLVCLAIVAFHETMHLDEYVATGSAMMLCHLRLYAAAAALGIAAYLLRKCVNFVDQE